MNNPNPSEQSPSQSRDFGEHTLDQTSAFDHTPDPSQSSTKSSPVVASNTTTKTMDRTIGGYRLIRLLGEGGMGRVFQAIDDSGRTIAIKVLSPELSRSPEALERFKQEGIIASAISHPNCVFVHCADDDHGTAYIAMELMTGQTLKDRVTQKGQLKAVEAVALILQCIDGLVEAHSRGMIHRDIKPANCYLDENGNVKIGDFGLARSLVSDSELTRTGSFLGTPLYASPEQILGEKVDEQSDIYSLAATLYFLLAGKAPFESPNAPQVIAKIVSADPPTFEESGVEIHRSLEKAVRRGLERDRSKRYKTLHEFRNELIHAIEPAAATASLGRRFIAWMLDSTLLSVFVAVFMLSLFGIVGLGPESLKTLGNLVGTLAQFIYFFAFEAIFGSTIGKMLLNLRVVNPVENARPKWSTCLIRTSTFVVLMNIIEWIVGLILFSVELSPLTEGVLNSIAAWASVALGCSVLYATWLRTGKRQLFHDWFSKTEVLLSTPKILSESIELNRPDWKLPLQSFESMSALPDRLGRYKVIGSIPTLDQKNSLWLSTRDDAIDRDVWVHYRPFNSLETSPNRMKCTRRTRMRFLETGVDAEHRWDAFVSPEGAPIRYWFSRQNPMPWSVTRSVLKDVINEINATDCSSANLAKDIDCWWINANGKATLSETPILSKLPGPRASTIFGDIAGLAIPNRDLGVGATKHTASKSSNEPILIPPLRATKLLQDIQANRITDSKIIEAELRKLENGPQSVSTKMRLVHSAILCILFGLPALVSLGVLSIPIVINLAETQRDAQRLTNFAAMLKEPEKYAPQIEKIEKSKRERYLDPNRIRRIEQLSDEIYDRFRDAFSRVGYVERAIVEQQGKVTGRDVSQKPVPQLPQADVPNETEAKLSDQSSDNTLHLNSRGIQVSLPQSKQQPIEFRETLDTVPAMVRTFEQWESEDAATRPFLTPQRTNRLIQMCCIPFAMLLIWGTITRGGLSHYFTGLAVVVRDGRRAGFMRCFVRTLWFWMPFFVIACVIVFLDTHGLQYVGWSQQLRRVFFALPLVYFGIATRFLQRGPHDALAGTFIAPR